MIGKERDVTEIDSFVPNPGGDAMKAFGILLTLFLLVGTPSMASARDDDRVEASLSGYNEVHFIFAAGPPASAALRGAVSTPAKGKFRAKIDKKSALIEYELSYQDLVGAVTQVHIHFGQVSTVGGIVVWLCQIPGTPAPAAVAALTPFCPPSGTVLGTITPVQVITVTGQGILAGEFDELVDAIRAGATYANVHSTEFPPGEVRDQIGSDDRHHR